jgi:hypothetical protein
MGSIIMPDRFAVVFEEEDVAGLAAEFLADSL